MPKKTKRKPNLILVKPNKLPEPKKPKSLKETKVRNFWNTCPRKLDSLPDEPCGLGYESSKMRGNMTPSCPWWVNSKEHNYCFWRWLKDKSTPDGKMDPLLQNEIAKLFGCSSTKVHFILKEALESLKKSEYLEILAEYVGEDTPEVRGAGVSLDSHISSYDSDSDE